MTEKLEDVLKATSSGTGPTTISEGQTGNISLGGDGTYGTVIPATQAEPSVSATATAATAVPPTCAQLLTTGQADATGAQGCATFIQNAAVALQPVSVYAQSLIQQAISGNPMGTQAQLAAAQAVAQTMQIFLTEISKANTQASGFSANATQAYNQAFTEHCGNVDNISALMAQASSAATSANSANNGMILYALLAQGILDITHPGPQVSAPPAISGPTVAPVTPVSFGPTFSFADGKSVLQMKIDEAYTQSLLTFLLNQEKGGTIQALAGSVASVLISELSTFLATGGLSAAALISGLFSFLMAEEATLLYNVVSKADNNGRGVAFNFGLETLGLVAGASLLPYYLGVLSIPAAFAACEVNLGKETSTPGGCGSQVDGFWITSN